MTRLAYPRATAGLVAALALLCAALYAAGDGYYFIKGTGESHSIYLTSANTHDAASFAVQDPAASSEPSAHPYWYTHHPNLPARALSLAGQAVGASLSVQVGFMLFLNVAALAVAVLAFERLAAGAGFAAAAVLAVSYGSFHYNAGDLLRGTHYLILWPTLLALVANPGLDRRRCNFTIATTIALAFLSDWGFAVFLAGLAAAWATHGRGRVPLGWLLRWIVAPAGAVLAAYLVAVAAVVGWEGFVLDVRATYLGRLGFGDSVDPAALQAQLREHRIMAWEGGGGRTLFSAADLLAALVFGPLRETGPVWIAGMVALGWALLRVAIRLPLGVPAWLAITAFAGANVGGVMPTQALLLPWLGLWWALSRAPAARGTPDRIAGFAACVMLGMGLAAIVFPSYVIQYLYEGGRPPMPLIEIAAALPLAAWFHATRGPTATAPRLPGGNALAVAVTALLAAVMVLLLLPRTSLHVHHQLTATMVALGAFGIATWITWGWDDGTAPGAVRALRWLPAALLVALCSVLYVHRAPALLTGTAALCALLAVAHATAPTRARLLAIGLAVALAGLASLRSLTPDVFGRYSVSLAALMLLFAITAVAAWAAGARDGSLADRLSALLRARIQGARALAALVLLAAGAGQLAWFVTSVRHSPPGPVPYASLLERPEYRGKSFLASSYEAIAWHATRGWTYMSPTNPPRLDPIDARFRHFADWADAKYDRPDYYLCDATRFSFTPPGTSHTTAPAPAMSCAGTCTCLDVVRHLAASGHSAEHAQAEYAIIRFVWAPSRGIAESD